MNKTTAKPHKNIRGKDYFSKAIEEAKQGERAVQTPILRLRAFVKWAYSEGLCESESDFERQCGLTTHYIRNNAANGKGNIGSEMLGRVIRVYPQLNLAWICTGEGGMTISKGIDMDYKQAYEGAMMQIEALNRIIRGQNK